MALSCSGAMDLQVALLVSLQAPVISNGGLCKGLRLATQRTCDR